MFQYRFHIKHVISKSQLYIIIFTLFVIIKQLIKLIHLIYYQVQTNKKQIPLFIASVSGRADDFDITNLAKVSIVKRLLCGPIGDYSKALQEAELRAFYRIGFIRTSAH